MPQEQIFIGEFIHICSHMATGETELKKKTDKRKRTSNEFREEKMFSFGKTSLPDFRWRSWFVFILADLISQTLAKSWWRRDSSWKLTPFWKGNMILKRCLAGNIHSPDYLFANLNVLLSKIHWWNVRGT